MFQVSALRESPPTASSPREAMNKNLAQLLVVFGFLTNTVAADFFTQSDTSRMRGSWRSISSTINMNDGQSRPNVNCDVDIQEHTWTSICTVRGKQYGITASYLCGDPVLGRFTCYAEVIADTNEVSRVGTKTRMIFEFDGEKLVTSTYPLLISGSSPNAPLSIVSVMVRK